MDANDDGSQLDARAATRRRGVDGTWRDERRLDWSWERNAKLSSLAITRKGVELALQGGKEVDVARIRDAYAREVISEGEVCIVAAACYGRDSCMREKRGGWMG